MKISILNKVKQLAAKVIEVQEEQLSFLEYLDSELKWHEAVLKQNDISSPPKTTLSNEPRITESIQVEKINWEAGLAELAFIIEVLFKNEDICFSMKHYKKRWSLIAKHFTAKGEKITSEGLCHA